MIRIITQCIFARTDTERSTVLLSISREVVVETRGGFGLDPFVP